MRAALAATLLLSGALVSGAPAPALVEVASPEPINKTVRIGTSVRGAPLHAYRRNAINASRRVLVLGSIHGDEAAGMRVVNYLRGHAGRFQPDIEVWLIPTINPDGIALGTRQNARRVDLNRNFPYQWRYDSTTKYYSGPSVASEPETKALVAFLKKYHPQTEMVFHQPLGCVSLTTTTQEAASIMSRNTGLPLKTLGSRHGSQSDYLHALVPGSIAMTVEFGRTPTDTVVNHAITGVRQVANSR